MIDKPAFDELARRRGRLLATIYQPTHAATGAAQEDLVRLRHVLEDIEKLANGGRVSHAMATTIRRRVHELDETELFGRGAGYAIFASPTDVRIVRMQRPVEELVYVGDRFCVRPLFGQLGDDARFHLLTLSRNAVRLVECEGGNSTDLELGTVAKGLAALPRVAEGGNVLQSHSAGSRGGRAEMFHGQGGAADLHKDEFRRLVHRLDEVLMEKVGNNPPPLVVAGVRYEVDFRSRLFFGDAVEAHIRVEAVGRTSLTYRLVVRRAAAVVAEARCVVAHARPDQERAEPWPDDVRALLVGAGAQAPERLA